MHTSQDVKRLKVCVCDDILDKLVSIESKELIAFVLIIMHCTPGYFGARRPFTQFLRRKRTSKAHRPSDPRSYQVSSARLIFTSELKMLLGKKYCWCLADS
jgi:hypothetical protein